MQSRRSFIGRMGAVIGGLMAVPLGAKAAFTDRRYLVSRTMGTSYAECDPIDVTGKPTPPELIKGAPGVTYFHATNCNVRDGVKCYLDGIVTDHASECDVAAGWIRSFSILPDGKFEFRQIPAVRFVDFSIFSGGGWRRTRRVHFMEKVPVEFIHFGRVELR